MVGRVRQLLAIAVLATLLLHLPESSTGSGLLAASAHPAGQVPEVTAEAVVIWDDQAGQVLYDKNPHKRFAPASITKIMTAVVAIERGDLDEVVSVETDAGELARRTDSTTMGLYPGERVSLRNLLYGLMLPSGNDAAIEIARHIGGSEAAFVALMNTKAEQLGMVDSHYMNPHGLDDGQHYTTAHDMTLLGRYAMQNATFAEIAGTRARIFYGYDGRKLYQLGNLDRLIGREGYDGIKIGFTENALSTYVATVQRNGRRLYLTLLRSQDRVREAQRLVDYFYGQPAPSTTTRRPSQSSRGAVMDTPPPPATPPTTGPATLTPPATDTPPVVDSRSTGAQSPPVEAPVGSSPSSLTQADPEPATAWLHQTAGSGLERGSRPTGPDRLLGLLTDLSNSLTQAVWHFFRR